MKAFRFRLDAVLVLRRQKEESSKADYALAVRERVSIENKRNDLREHIGELRRCITETRQGTFRGGMQQGYYHALLSHEENLECLGKTLFNASVHEENALRAYIASKKDRELVERWRERQRKAYHQRVIKEEEAETEDLVNARYVTTPRVSRTGFIS